jgi:hypothetical protein
MVKDAKTSSAGMTPCLKRLGVTVGMLLVVAGNREPTVKSTGPRLQDCVDAIEKHGQSFILTSRYQGSTYERPRNNKTRSDRHHI